MPTWKYFTRDEFACKCGCGTNLIKDAFVGRLDLLREKCGFPLHVNSGYRCPKHNAAVSETGGTGPHTTGEAADIKVDRTNAYVLLGHAFALGFTGIGIQQKGASRYVHLDTLVAPAPRPTVWSY